MLHYSIHTYELFTKLSYYEYYKIYQILIELRPAIEKKIIPYPQKNLEKTNIIFRKLSIYGINSIELNSISCENSVLQNFLYIIVNPHNALHSCSQSDEKIILPDQIEAADLILYDQLAAIFPVTLINRLSVSRIDFCVNLPFPSQPQAEEYIHLLRLGVPPKVLKEQKIYDRIQRREIPYKDSLLLECQSYSFEVYPKYTQMKKRKLKNPECATGIVRIELRAYKQKLLQLARKYNLPSPKCDYHAFLIHAPYIAREEITKLLSKMVGSKDFYNYSYVKEKILQSDFSDIYIKCMLNTISYFSRRKYCGDFLNTFGLKQKDWKNIIQKFEQIGCSPITIPDNYFFKLLPGIESWDTFFI